MSKREYEKIELEHAAMMERIAKRCSSKKSGFTVTDKLDAIASELEGSGYIETRTESYSMWSKRGVDIPGSGKRGVVMVSTHADFVDNITNPSSKLDDEGYYRGTYDNLGTNAAAVALMKEENLPDNVVFVFTSEEESGRCTGLHRAVEDLRAKGALLLGVALDVTYEGYDEGKLCSVENLSGGWLVDRVGEIAMALEPDGCDTFSFVRLNKHEVPAGLPKEKISGSFGMFDEAFAFKKDGVPAFSFCLPCSGSMHSNSGVKVRQPVFEGYLVTLYSYLCELTRSASRSQVVEAYKVARAELCMRAAEMVAEEAAAAKEVSSLYRNWDDYSVNWGGDTYVSEYDDLYDSLTYGTPETEEELYEMAQLYGPEDLGGFLIDVLYAYFEAGYTPSTLESDAVEKLEEVFSRAHGRKARREECSLELEDFYDGYMAGKLEEEEDGYHQMTLDEYMGSTENEADVEYDELE